MSGLHPFRRALRIGAALAAATLAPLAAHAQAQATVEPDGRFRYALGAGGSWASGNTDSASVNVNGEAVRATPDSRLRFGGKALWTRDDGRTTAENVSFGALYNRDFTPLWFGFGTGDFLRDKFANIAARYSIHGGIGRHVVKSEGTTFDVSAGLGYTEDRYLDDVEIDGVTRGRLGRAEALLAEESLHKWTATTTLRQKLSIFPALRSGGGLRATFDTGLAVAMTTRLNLTVGLTVRYDSDPGSSVPGGADRDYEKVDTLFVTGIALKFD